MARFFSVIVTVTLIFVILIIITTVTFVMRVIFDCKHLSIYLSFYLSIYLSIYFYNLIYLYYNKAYQTWQGGDLRLRSKPKNHIGER